MGSRFCCWPAGPTGGVRGPLGAARRASHGAGAEGLAAVSSPGATERWEKVLGARRWGGLLPSGSWGYPRLPRASPAPRPRCPPRGGEHGRAGAPLVGRDGTGRGGGGVSAGKGRGEPPRWRTLPSAFLFVSVKVPDVPSETRSEAFRLNAFTSLETRLL